MELSQESVFTGESQPQLNGEKDASQIKKDVNILLGYAAQDRRDAYELRIWLEKEFPGLNVCYCSIEKIHDLTVYGELALVFDFVFTYNIDMNDTLSPGFRHHKSIIPVKTKHGPHRCKCSFYHPYIDLSSASSIEAITGVKHVSDGANQHSVDSPGLQECTEVRALMCYSNHDREDAISIKQKLEVEFPGFTILPWEGTVFSLGAIILEMKMKGPFYLIFDHIFFHKSEQLVLKWTKYGGHEKDIKIDMKANSYIKQMKELTGIQHAPQNLSNIVPAVYPQQFEEDPRWLDFLESADENVLDALLREWAIPTAGILCLVSCKLGFDSGVVERICNQICEFIQSQSDNFSRVWVGYRPERQDHPVFVIITSGVGKSQASQLPYPLTTFDLIFRDDGKCSVERNEVIYSQECTDKLFSTLERESIRKCIQANSKELMNSHSNLNMISACAVRSINFGTNQAVKEKLTCIVLYVHVKGVIPKHEKCFPKQIKAGDIAYPVDVREGLFTPLYTPSAQQPHRVLKMGCKIGSDINQPKGGTLGAFVDLDSNGTIGCITCAHVLLPEKLLNKIAKPSENPNLESELHGTIASVFQPANDSNELPFGHIRRAIFRHGGIGDTGLDVALIDITDKDRIPQTGDFPGGNFEHTGFNESNKLRYASGDILHNVPQDLTRWSELFKFGCSTGCTRGGFYLQGTSVRRNSMGVHGMVFGFELHDQIEVVSTGKPFAEHGDSGAIVLAMTSDEHNLKALGLIEGGTTAGTYLVTPIWDILNELNLPARLKQFQDKGDNSSAAGLEHEQNSNLDVQNMNLETVGRQVTELKHQVSEIQEHIAKQSEEVKSLSTRMEQDNRKNNEDNAKILQLLMDMQDSKK